MSPSIQRTLRIITKNMNQQRRESNVVQSPPRFSNSTQKKFHIRFILLISRLKEEGNDRKEQEDIEEYGMKPIKRNLNEPELLQFVSISRLRTAHSMQLKEKKFDSFRRSMFRSHEKNREEDEGHHLR
jgi:hypothetical protein